MRILFAILIMIGLGFSNTANAQMSATRDAQRLAVLAAVMNFKIDDEEHIRDIERLRESDRFNQRVQRMLDQLTNRRTKNTTNRRVMQILDTAGRDLMNLLD